MVVRVRYLLYCLFTAIAAKPEISFLVILNYSSSCKQITGFSASLFDFYELFEVFACHSDASFYGLRFQTIYCNPRTEGKKHLQSRSVLWSYVMWGAEHTRAHRKFIKMELQHSL